MNIETFTSLLLVLYQELERVASEHTDDQPRSVVDNVTAVARRMLPSLRLYSIWLLVNHKTLTNQIDDTSLNVQIKQLWQIYANSLSLLLATFPLRFLPNLDYLLEEDEDVLGFQPFALITLARNASLRRHLPKDRREHPNQEVLARVLYLIEDGCELCTEEVCFFNPCSTDY